MATLADLGSTSLGLWTRRAALAVASAGRVDGFVRRGEWQAPWPGVYADSGSVLDAEQRAVAAVLASGGEAQFAAVGSRPAAEAGVRTVQLRAVAAGRTAARVHQLPLVDDDDPATGAADHRFDEVLVWRNTGSLTATCPDGTERVLDRQRGRVTRAELVRRDSGLWVLSPARTLLDLVARVSEQALVCAATRRRVLATADRLRRGRAAG